MHALWTATPGIRLNESDTPEAIALFFDRNPHLSLVALDSTGTIVGYHDGCRGYLHHLVSAPSARNLGLARAITRAASPSASVKAGLSATTYS